MSESHLTVYKGARIVTLDELMTVPAPPATDTWFPLSHGHVVRNVEKALAEAGFQVTKSQYALTRGDNRLFAVLDLASVLADGVTLAVGVRNSTDRSLPIGFAAGNRVAVCEN